MHCKKIELVDQTQEVPPTVLHKTVRLQLSENPRPFTGTPLLLLLRELQHRHALAPLWEHLRIPIRRLVRRVPLLLVIDEAARGISLGRGWGRWIAEGVVMSGRRGTLLADEAKCPIRQVEAAEDDDGCEDLII